MSLEAGTAHHLLKAAVQRAGEKLGFILLTGGSENFVRDCLAYECFKAGLLATRDFRTRDYDGNLHIVDLAIGQRDGLDALVELKQFYLKDFKSANPLYFGNVTRDILKRAPLRSTHRNAAVYGVVLLREVDLSAYVDNGQFLAYAAEDFRHLASGVSRMHSFLQAAPGMESCVPIKLSEAKLAEWSVDGASVRLYGWVLTPRSSDDA
jgi:hypothetical protein